MDYARQQSIKAAVPLAHLRGSRRLIREFDLPLSHGALERIWRTQGLLQRRRGFEVSGEYVDNGVSGAKERRPHLDRLLADCRRRLMDAVVVYRYDRFARSLRQLVNALEEFRSLGIDFISLHEGVDTSTPNGRLVFGIFASIAEFERELIRDRVKSGIAAARRTGKRLGRPRVFVDRNKVDSLRAQGLAWTTIAEQMGLGEGTIRRAAQNH